MPPGNNEVPDAEADVLTSTEAAEQAAAEAEVRAQVARERANELRRKLETARGDTPATLDSAELAEDTDIDAEGTEIDPEPAVALDIPTPQRRRFHIPGLKAAAVTLAALLIAGSLAGTGYMMWQHRKAADQQHSAAEFAAAARQGVVNLMSMDSTAAKESVQRVIDNSTGKFQANVKDGADDLIKAMQDAKVVTKVTVNDVAVEKIEGDSAVVLVAATSERSDAKAPQADKQPRVWRVIITVVRDGGQIKVSDVEFA